ncbi:MAG TPA: hypothetical protein PLD74_03020 [Prolixibacteraceae bacterium]|nr:MAG: hypothetical protein BWX87_01472 [Bacteroidetes bacterium ADurb.Bin123]HOF54915.1 hypothetical protein [Prolixibacteraceae bacterium]HOR99881.1 hypothetical protein [Prolixibacteraceae bacterium]HOS89770.1 hypothetical protein [Prolixibacteraceae bacterium]HPI35669.1 hypothetical protein [Prolixibacteraceae bacterium]
MTRTKLEQAIQQLALVEKELMSIPGVNAVDVGYKYVNGVVTDEICIRVHVKKKKKKVPKKERIPDEINGIKTDIIEADYGLL